MRLVNDTASTVTAKVTVEIEGESVQAAHDAIARLGCTPPIGGCVVAKHVLAPGQSTAFPLPKNDDTRPYRYVIVTGYGASPLCLPLASGPPAVPNPIFKVSDILSNVTCP
jgi:hypothetical protein